MTTRKFSLSACAVGFLALVLLLLAMGRETFNASNDDETSPLPVVIPTFTTSVECSAHTKCNICVATGECVWCASTAQCASPPSDTNTEAQCEDMESGSCPAILLGPLPMNIRVVHVGIRKGGPEALIQMHLALVFWGFQSTLDTRHEKKEKGGNVMPFFKTVYAKEFEKSPPLRWFQTYQEWLTTGVDGDVFLETETWPCKNGLRFETNGVRQMQWHLTVWAKKDRRDCAIAGHTHFIAAEYMELSHRAVMFPYISPHIVALSKTQDWKKMKKDLVMYDSDTHLKPEDLTRSTMHHELQIATGMTPDQLYAKYQVAKVGIDLAMPGAERFIYEASLFQVCIIVDTALNGNDALDLPIPDRFRVPPKDLTALNARKEECLTSYDSVISEFEPLRRHVLAQRVNFYRHVRTYYSNNIHIVTSACRKEDGAHIAPFILSVLFQIPFATVEVFLGAGVGMQEGEMIDLRDRSYLASVHMHHWWLGWRTGPPVDQDDMHHSSEYCPADVLVRRPHTTTAKRTKYIAWIAITQRLARHDFVNFFATDASLDLANGLVRSTQPNDFVFGEMKTGVTTEALRVGKKTYLDVGATPFVLSHADLPNTEALRFFCLHPVWRRNVKGMKC